MTERPPLVYSLLCAYVPFSLYGFRHPGVVVVFVVARVLSGLLVIDAPSSKVSRNKIKLPPPAASPLHLASDAGVPPPPTAPDLAGVEASLDLSRRICIMVVVLTLSPPSGLLRARCR